MGDPKWEIPYTIRLTIPENTIIQVQMHRGNRTAVVASGICIVGYGDALNPAAEKALPPASYYSEPAGAAHFEQTHEQAVMVYISGCGPSVTAYVCMN